MAAEKLGLGRGECARAGVSGSQTQPNATECGLMRPNAQPAQPNAASKAKGGEAARSVRYLKLEARAYDVGWMRHECRDDTREASSQDGGG